ncbi:MAG: flagellar biosynthetic protein FliR [Proteobacteria bacterium]|nr:flagellar biosynthetic protein FliR [Pseudomonadota bacterium]
MIAASDAHPVTALLDALPALAFAFALVLARLAAAVMLLPGFAETGTPAMLRAGFALALALLLTPVIAPLVPATPDSGSVAAAMVMAEVVTGLWLGWLARMAVQALAMAGQVLSYMIGLSNVLQPDPDLGAQATAVARLLGMAAPVLILASGLYAAPLRALAGSYRLIAPGALLPAPDAAPGVLAAFADAFALALRLAAPFVLAGVVWQVAVGLLARVAPRVQIQAIAAPGQIAGGLFLLAALAGGLLAAWHGALNGVWADLPGLHESAPAAPIPR